MSENREPKDVLEFAAALTVNLYPWQAKVCLTIDRASSKKRVKLALKAPNESGKSSRVIALSGLWWLVDNPKGRVVVIGYDYRQVADQIWPAIQAQLSKFPGWHVRHAERTIETPTGGRLRVFVVDDPRRAEGFHSDVDCPLLIMVDECKSIPPDILQAIDRCSYNVLVYVSSPDKMEGTFYDAFTVNSDRFLTFSAGLTDCPHISKEKIADIEATYGKDHPFTRSALYGEFMTHTEGVNHILELPDRETWVGSSVGQKPGLIVFALDFACGGDDNVILKLVGNRITEISAWKEVNTAVATGEFIHKLHQWGYDPLDKNMVVIGDAGGPGRPICDRLRESGVRVVYFNFGGKCTDSVHHNEGTRAWYKVAKMIRDGELMPPPRNHPGSAKLLAQLTSRRQKMHSSGKLWMEEKSEMRARGVKSPDVADALAMAVSVQKVVATSYMPFDDSGRMEIAHKHGWQYTSDDDESYKDRRDWNRPGSDDGGGLAGFGGVNTDGW